MKNRNSTFIAMAITALLAGSLAGCARGGGIGLEAIVADGLCEQQGFHLGTRNMRTAVPRSLTSGAW